MNKRQRKKDINKRFKSLGGFRRFKAMVNVMRRFDIAVKMGMDTDSIQSKLQERIYFALTAPIEDVKAAGYLSNRTPFTIDYETRGIDREMRTAPKVNITVKL